MAPKISHKGIIKELFLKINSFFLVLPSPSGRNFGTSLDLNIITQDDDDGNGDEDRRCLRRVQRWWSDILDTSIPGIAQTGFHFLIKKKIIIVRFFFQLVLVVANFGRCQANFRHPCGVF